MPIPLGSVGHFSLAVSNPRRSARWWTGRFDVRVVFEFSGGVAVGNDAITIAFFKGKPRPRGLEHMSFHLPNMSALRNALGVLKEMKTDIEDPGHEIGPEGPGSKNVGLWFRDEDGYRWELSVLAKGSPRPKKRGR